MIPTLPLRCLIENHDFILPVFLYRLDTDVYNIKKVVQYTSIILDQRLSTKCILEFGLSHLNSQNSNIRKKSIVLMASVILSKGITPSEIGVISKEFVKTLFDTEPKFC